MHRGAPRTARHSAGRTDIVRVDSSVFSHRGSSFPSDSPGVSPGTGPADQIVTPNRSVRKNPSIQVCRSYGTKKNAPAWGADCRGGSSGASVESRRIPGLLTRCRCPRRRRPSRYRSSWYERTLLWAGRSVRRYGRRSSPAGPAGDWPGAARCDSRHKSSGLWI